jgi:hypothetical protein
MLKDIIKVKPLKAFRLHLEFEDGAQGEVDIHKLVRFTGIFEHQKMKPSSLKWTSPSGALFCKRRTWADVLCSIVTGEEVPEANSISSK